MTTTQPNIVVIMADFLSALALPMYGNSTVSAPNLKRLGESGVVFENAYCNAAVCGPSRASLLTGLLPSKVGVYDNGSELPASVPTLAHYLRLAGYRTYLSGKMHLMGPDQLHGFEERLTTDIVPSDFGWSPAPGGGHVKLNDEYPGYPNLDDIVNAGPCVRCLGIEYDDLVTSTSVNKIYEHASREDAPIFLTVSYIQPHPPYATPIEYWDRYENSEIPPPSVLPIPIDEYDPLSRQIFEYVGGSRTQLTSDHVSRARHAYYGMISHLDDRVGQILGALEAAGLDRETVVVVTSDHGTMLGERGLWGLRVPFEWGMRVPFVFHCPDEFAPRRVAAPVSLVDLLPTLVELAGGPKEIPNPVDGISLVGCLQGPGGATPHQILAEHCGEGFEAPWFMVRRGRYKLACCGTLPPLLFDLEEDPEERRNLATDPAHAAALDELCSEVHEHWDVKGLPERIAESVQRRATIFEANKTGRPPVWDYAVNNDPFRLYQRNYREAWEKTEERALIR